MTVRPQPPSPSAPPIDPDSAARIAAERQEAARIVVPDNLETSHPLVERTRQVLEKTRANEEGLLIAPASRPCLNISVARDVLERALRIMHAFIHALEQRGYAVTVATDDGATWVRLPEGRVQMSLVEKIDREETERYRAAKASDSIVFLARTEKWIFKPSGQFKLTVMDEDSYHSTQWKDSASRPLENQLNLVVAGVIRTVENCRVHRIKLVEDELQRREDERRRLEESRRKYELDRLAKIFEDHAAQWSHTQNLRAFIQALEHSITTAQGITAIRPGSPEDIWLRWVNAYVRQMDPLINGAAIRAVRAVAINPVVRDLFGPKDRES